MTKRFEFNWHIPVPEQLLKGCYFERWTEEKENVEYESKCLFRVDEYGFFIYWKSECRVSNHTYVFYISFVTLRLMEWNSVSVMEFCSTHRIIMHLSVLQAYCCRSCCVYHESNCRSAVLFICTGINSSEILPAVH
jgi:hypothetical protein